MRTWAYLAAGMALLALAVPCLAGTSEDPEATDPEGDVAASGGSPLQPVLDAAGEGDAFDDVDLTAVWLDQERIDDVGEPSPPLHFHIASVAEVQDDTETWINFTVDRGPTSVFGSTASGQAWSVHLVGDAFSSGPERTSAMVQGDGTLKVSLYTIDIGASGGDVIANLTVERARSSDEIAPLVAPGEQAHDRMPDSGAARAFTLERPAIVPGAALAVLGGRIIEEAGTRTVTGDDIRVQDPQGSVELQVRVRNTGSDVDRIVLEVASGPRSTATMDAVAFELAPAEAAVATVRIDLDVDEEAARRGTTETVTITAASTHGAEASLPVHVQVVPPGSAVVPDPGDTVFLPDPDDDRQVRPAGLAWLTPAAEAMGLDHAFGEWAELVLLALLVLLAILAVVLALAWVVPRRERTPLPATPAPYPLPAEDGPPQEPRPQLSLSEVRHDPEHPRPGDDVTTSVTVSNRSKGRGARLRVVLRVDGEVVRETIQAVLANTSVRMRLPWRAGGGENRVQVQVFDAA